MSIECNYCRTINSDEAEYCINCGRSLNSRTIPYNKNKTPNSNSSPQKDPLFRECPYCLEMIKNDAAKCKYCQGWSGPDKNSTATAFAYLSLILFWPVSVVFSMYLITRDDPRARRNGLALILAAIIIAIITAAIIVAASFPRYRF